MYNVQDEIQKVNAFKENNEKVVNTVERKLAQLVDKGKNLKERSARQVIDEMEALMLSLIHVLKGLNEACYEFAMNNIALSASNEFLNDSIEITNEIHDVKTNNDKQVNSKSIDKLALDLHNFVKVMSCIVKDSKDKS